MTVYWKTFAGICIYRSDNELSIHQNFLYRWLIFNNQTKVLQTLIHRRRPQKAILKYLIPFTYFASRQPGPTCLLGLGGGAVAHYMAPYMTTQPLTAVESNQDVIDLAAEYFMINRLKNLTILHEDAQIFVSQSPHSYQHILVDIYAETGYPKQCSDSDFFSACKRLLLPDGVLALNLANFSQEIPILKTLQTVFPQGTVCIPVKATASLIVLACRSGLALTTLLSKSPDIKRLVWDSQLGYMAELKI